MEWKKVKKALEENKAKKARQMEMKKKRDVTVAEFDAKKAAHPAAFADSDENKESLDKMLNTYYTTDPYADDAREGDVAPIEDPAY